MGKIEFNIPTHKKKSSEENEDLYETILNLNNSEEDLLENSEDEQTDDDDDFSDYSEIDAVDLGPKLTKRLREELGKFECDRDYLRFKYRGEIFEGIPIHELNPGKFIFDINGKLKGVNLKEAIIL